ncbi:hypothetical protein [Paenibacillus dakarensis]|uniref:hypothetical protein n=1 Tax=Paenibacillus dakarensis TaxID=1527293 RepID=UPI0006D5ABA5|nr:hypothetical protein [Paenibacillus dakarensis]
MNDTVLQLANEAKKLKEEEQLSPEATKLIDQLLEELETLARQNVNLRKAALKATSKQSRMSSKLKDALYE